MTKRGTGQGIALAIASAATFGTSGSFATSLFDAGFASDHALALGLVEHIPYLARQQRLTFARAGLTDERRLAQDCL